MGGYGSGRWHRREKKDTVEGHKRLDVRKIRRENLLRPGSSFGWQWSEGGKPIGDIRIQVEDSCVILKYRSRRSGEDWKNVEERVPLSFTRCNFGGSRAWFVCPGVFNGRHCGRRVAILYAVGTYFLCRHCYDLTYESRNESEPFRFLTKA